MKSTIRARWTRPLLIYALITAVSATVLVIAAGRQPALGPGMDAYTTVYETPQSPGYWGVITNWDGQWFRLIAESGYPVALPAEDGQLVQNAWAFWPLYPLTVGTLMSATGLPFSVAAWSMSICCGALAAVAIDRLAMPRLGAFGAGALVACTFSFVSAPVLQTAYPESMALLLVVLSLSALQRRRYTVVAGLVLALSLTRPVVLPMAGAIAVHGAHRWWLDRQEEEEFPRRSRFALLALCIWCASLLGLWPLIADRVTGERNVYLRTLDAWPVNQRNGGVVGGWLGEIFQGSLLGWSAVICLLTVGVLVARRGAAAWSPELRGWMVLYPIYLVLSTRPSSSIIRYALLTLGPFWPLPELSLLTSDRVRRLLAWLVLCALMTVGVMAQYWWVTNVFTIDVAPSEQPFP